MTWVERQVRVILSSDVAVAISVHELEVSRTNFWGW